MKKIIKCILLAILVGFSFELTPTKAQEVPEFGKLADLSKGNIIESYIEINPETKIVTEKVYQAISQDFLVSSLKSVDSSLTDEEIQQTIQQAEAEASDNRVEIDGKIYYVDVIEQSYDYNQAQSDTNYISSFESITCDSTKSGVEKCEIKFPDAVSIEDETQTVNLDSFFANTSAVYQISLPQGYSFSDKTNLGQIEQNVYKLVLSQDTLLQEDFVVTFGPENVSKYNYLFQLGIVILICAFAVVLFIIISNRK